VRCSEDALNTARVTLWTMSQAFDVALDGRLNTVGPPSIAIDPTWPAPGGSPVPDVKAPTIKGAPRVVADREPYPYCGRAKLYEPTDAFTCFRDAVLARRPAEMIHKLYGIEGGEILYVYRYDGQGRVLRFNYYDGTDADGNAYETWWRSEGAMILGTGAFPWAFDPWEATNRKLPS
jgi:hypothetical protein